MTERKMAGWWMVLLGAIGLLLLLVYIYWSKGVYVSIINNTQKVLEKVSIAYTGGTINIEKLEPHTSYGQYVNPASESHLELEWFEPSGVKQSHKIDVYFEHNYSGSIEITVDPNNRISWISKVRVRLLLEIKG